MKMTGVSEHTNPTSAMAPQQQSTRWAQTSQDALKVLTAMAQHQSPDQPMNPKEFGDQIIKFMSVEQSMRTNERLDDLVRATEKNQRFQAYALVGKDVWVEEGSFSPSDSVAFRYMCDQPLKKGQLCILDDTHHVVRRLDLPSLHAGSHEIAFDGRDHHGRKLSADRAYRPLFVGMDANDQPATVALHMRGRVTGIRHEDRKTFLMMKESSHALDNLHEVSDTPQVHAVPIEERSDLHLKLKRRFSEQF